jgi:hypothetical protein
MAPSQEPGAAQASLRAGSRTAHRQPSGSRRRCKPEESLTSRPRAVKPEAASVRPGGIPGKPCISNPIRNLSTAMTPRGGNSATGRFGNWVRPELAFTHPVAKSPDGPVAIMATSGWAPGLSDKAGCGSGRGGRPGASARPRAHGPFLTVIKAQRRFPSRGFRFSPVSARQINIDSTGHRTGQPTRDRFPFAMTSGGTRSS